MLTARPYQIAAVDAVFDRLVVHDEPSTLVILPTGMGKTVVFGLVAQKWSRGHPGRILVLAHREELISQAVAELHGILGTAPAVEMADARALPTGSTLTADANPVVVASVPTLCQQKRLARWPQDEFGLIVTDEAHHATAASYRRIYDHFKGAKRLGVTATPKRADDIALGTVFGNVCFEMGISDAVEEGWLVPVQQRYVTVRDMDLSAVGTVAGEFDQKQLGAVLSGDRILDQMVAATIELCGDEPTLIFTAPRPPGEDQSQGELFADALNKIRPDRAMFLSGETERDVRRREIEQFELGRRQYLVGCALFTEGFNVPAIARVVMARPTKSVVYYTQAIGRGTRSLRGVLQPEHDTPEKRQAAIRESKKPHVLVIDFVGNSGRHKLCSAVDIFAGNLNPDAVARAKKKAERTGRDVREVLAEAAAELKREAERKAERGRKNKPRVKVNRVTMHQEDVNPYETTDAPGQRARAPQTGRATTNQIEWINSHGGVAIDTLTAAAAGRMIADIQRRWREGLCSPKQERTLRKFQLVDGPIPKNHAKALLDWISAREWVIPKEPIRRSQMGIVKVQNGLIDGYQLTIDKIRVGMVFESPDKVREVYSGLVANHLASVNS